MEIRPATSADIRAIAEVHVASWQAAYAGIVPAQEIAKRDVATRTEQWKEIVGSAIVLVAVTRGAIAGFVSADGATGAVAAIYVAPEHARAGVGTRLLAAAHHELRAAGRARAHLWVLAANEPALAFYVARGYEPDGTTDTWEGEPTLRLSTAL